MPRSAIALLLSWLLPVCLVGLTGCGTGDGAAGTQTLRVVRNIGGREGFRIHWLAWKAAFEKKNPGWTLELIDLGNANGAEYYKTRAATGDLPEVVMVWNMAGFLADGGNLVPLPDEFYTSRGIPLPSPYKGKRYTSQGGIQIQGMIVNKKMWNDAGVTAPPATWDEFIDGLKKLKARGYKPLVYGAKDWSAFMPMAMSINSDVYDRVVDPAKPSWNKLKDEGKVSFVTDKTMRLIVKNMIELLDNFVEKGASSDGYNEQQRDFYTGKGATWIMGCWVGGDIEPNKVEFEMEYWPIPSMVGRPPTFWRSATLQNGWSVTTAAKGPKLEKALAVLDAFYEPESYQLFLNGEAQLSAAEKVPVQGPKSSWPVAQKLYDNMAENYKKFGATEGSRPALDDMPPLAHEQSLMRLMQEILAGNKDIDKLLKMLDDDWESARKGL